MEERTSLSSEVYGWIVNGNLTVTERPLQCMDVKLQTHQSKSIQKESTAIL